MCFIFNNVSFLVSADRNRYKIPENLHLNFNSFVVYL